MKKKTFESLFLVLPALLCLSLFFVIPALSSFYFSFTDKMLIAGRPVDFIGLQNYRDLINDYSFRQSIGNTFYFALLVVPFQTSLALALALFVNRSIKGIAMYRAAYFAPVVTSMVVVSVIWSFIYNPEIGLITMGLRWFGIPPQPFLTSPRQAMPALVVMSAWQGAGMQMMIFLAGLQSIPKELYEAAKIDGAGRWKTFLHVTLPGLRNTMEFVIVITIIFALKLFVQPYVMTNGGPQGCTRTILLYLYEQGFSYGQIGIACAVAALLFLSALLIVIIQVQFQKKG